MIALVYRSDVHMAVQAPESRTDDWVETVLDKLDQVAKIAKARGAKAVVDNGDFFHIKTPSRTTHDLVQRVSTAHIGYGIPTFVNVGNHDCKYGDISFLPESPLGVLFSTGVFQRCYDGHEAIFRDEQGLTVRVVGVPYHGKSYDMNRLTTIVKGSEDFLVVMAHLLASQGGGEMFGGEDIVRYRDLVNLDPDLWAFGHWHKNQGVTKLGPKTFVNIGSLTRGALSEDEMTRIPECAVFTFSREHGVQVEQVPLKVRPAAEVFDVAGRVRQEARAMTVEAFVESMQATLVPHMEGSLLDQVRALDTPDAVKERLIAYLEAEGAS